MKKYIVIIMMLMSPLVGASAQALQGINVDVLLVKTYNEASTEDKEKMKDLIDEVETRWKKRQVKEICGVNFGEKQEVALEVLKGKFGEPYCVTKDCIWYRYITYGGVSFEDVLFQFQSDGKRTYMNQLSFLSRKENNKESLIDDFNRLSEKLKKYSLEQVGENTLSGGISPLWDGDVNHIDIKHIPAIILGIVKNEDGKYFLALCYGHPKYGPFNYVKEEF